MSLVRALSVSKNVRTYINSSSLFQSFKINFAFSSSQFKHAVPTG